MNKLTNRVTADEGQAKVKVAFLAFLALLACARWGANLWSRCAGPASTTG